MNQEVAQAVRDSAPPKTVTIVVNGQDHKFPKTDITYDEVVALAFPISPDRSLHRDLGDVSAGPWPEARGNPRAGRGGQREGRHDL